MEKQVSTESLIEWQLSKPWVGPVALEGIQKSVDVEGIIEPIVVRKAGRKWEILDGHHRWTAAKRLKLSKVPIRVLDLEGDDVGASRVVYSLNENRKDKTADHYMMSWESRWVALDNDGKLGGTWLENRRTVAEDLDKQTQGDKWLTGERDQVGENAVMASMALEHGITSKVIGGRHVNGQDSALAIVRAYSNDVKRIKEAEKHQVITEAKAAKGLKSLKETLVRSSAENGHAADVTADLHAVTNKVAPRPKPEADPGKPLVTQCTRVRKWAEAQIKHMEIIDKELGPALRFAPDNKRMHTEMQTAINELERLEKQLAKFKGRIYDRLHTQKATKPRLQSVSNK
jgi:hypothetical protein